MDDNVKNPNKKKLVYIAIPIVVFVLVLICIGPLQKASKYNRALSEIESLSTRQEGIDLLKTLELYKNDKYEPDYY